MRKAATLVIVAVALLAVLVLLTRPRQPEPVPEQPRIVERTVESETVPEPVTRDVPEESAAPEPAPPEHAVPEVAVEPETGGFIEGYAYDEEGDGIPDVTVSASAQSEVVDAPAGIVPVGYITDRDAGSAGTEDSGRYRIEAPQGEVFSLAFKHKDYQNAHLGNVALGTTEANVVMRPRGSVSGVVLDAVTRDPVREFSIALGIQSGFGASGMMGFRGLRRMGGPAHAFGEPEPFQSEMGEFIMKPNQMGKVALRATAAGYAPKEVSDLVVRSGEETSGVVILLVGGSMIRGWVVATPYSRPVAAADVSTSGPGRPMNMHTTTTDAQGLFMFGDLAAGEYSILVKHSDYPPTHATVTVDEAREHGVTIRLESGGTVAGYVTENGRAASGADIKVSDSELNRHSTTSDERGYYEVAALLPGRCSVQASLGPNEQIDTVEVWDGLTTQKDFEFWRGTAAIEGYVTLNGEPLPAGIANVMVLPESGPLDQYMREHKAGEDGYYRVDDLGAGTFNVAALIEEGDRMLARSALAQTAPNRVTRIDLDILAGTATMVGTVSCPEAEGPQQVFVVLRNASAPAPSLDNGIAGFITEAVAGSSCRPNEPYEIPLVPAGSYEVTAVYLEGDNPIKPTALRHSSRLVTVEEGQLLEIDFSL